ncbi:hypothetical protein, partial [Kocuria rhizophila]
EATGYGAVMFGEEMVKTEGKRFEGGEVIVSGWGKVGM